MLMRDLRIHLIFMTQCKIVSWNYRLFMAACWEAVIWWHGSSYFCIFYQTAAGWSDCGWAGCRWSVFFGLCADTSFHRYHWCSVDGGGVYHLPCCRERPTFEWSKRPKMLVLHWLDWTAIRVEDWGLIITWENLCCHGDPSNKEGSRTKTRICFFSWESFYIQCTFSKLNWSPDFWTALPGRLLLQNLSFLQLFSVMIWLI